MDLKDYHENIKFISSFLVVLSTQSSAEQFQIQKDIQPYRMLVLSAAGGISGASASVSGFDLDRIEIPYYQRKGKITGVEYTTASYPAPNEIVEICYVRPYRIDPLFCDSDIAPNSTGITHRFDGQEFAPGIEIKIIHRVDSTGELHYSAPNRMESVTIHYDSYR
ncbi:hypothetical protein [Marinomonas sp. 2405UD68-3]|uniref:hypothetical protein n=1 Tax=Marinomonas sp. 2405UD68-3 TaxID=3391835 RepID=UPI0039C8F4C0